MSRTIEVTIIDDASGNKMTGTTNLDGVNNLYYKHGLNGVMVILHIINTNLNTELKENEHLAIPDEINVLPKGKKW